MHCVGVGDGTSGEDGRRQGEATGVEGPGSDDGMSQREEEFAEVSPSLACSQVPAGLHTECVEAVRQGASPTASFIGNAASPDGTAGAADCDRGGDSACEEFQVLLAWGGSSCTSPKNITHALLPAEETEVEKLQASVNLANSGHCENSLVGGDYAGLSSSWASRQQRLQNRSEHWRQHEAEAWRRKYEQAVSARSPAVTIKMPPVTKGTALQNCGDDADKANCGSGGVISDAEYCGDAPETRSRRFGSLATRRLCRQDVESTRREDDETAVPLWQTFLGNGSP
ncbi:uncharacterized protein Tco025E_03054 [Trypanosoma conorhini]|uniref:Uncharacterized protein n=1 Tax=Trypanosoma conorhini TaxID=83891 RepID=A0A3R7L7G4_9TRYP|nr:uncharacterized protein Tco025E_03054 [Trypanosoma conorhini]RNF22567.1 hypothetical protein Tco025E_03054 [Trypanosoma conorhini]